MPKVLVTYYSRTGNTAKMAEAIAAGAKSEGVEVVLKKVKETKLDDLVNADGIIIGSPTYFGLMASEVKRLIDISTEVRGKLEDKVGAAFTSSGNVHGGNQTALISIHQSMLIHAMIVVGDPMESGGYYGAIAVGHPSADCEDSCKMLGARVARLVNRLAK